MHRQVKWKMQQYRERTKQHKSNKKYMYKENANIIIRKSKKFKTRQGVKQGCLLYNILNGPRRGTKKKFKK